jgi:hypothetical protein
VAQVENFCKIQKGSSTAKEKIKTAAHKAKLPYHTLPTPKQKILG